MTSASTETRTIALRVQLTSLSSKVRHAEALIIAAWRGLLLLASFAAVALSIYSILLYGPHPVISGVLTALLVICCIRFEAAVRSVRRKGSPEHQ